MFLSGQNRVEVGNTILNILVYFWNLSLPMPKIDSVAQLHAAAVKNKLSI